MPDLYLVPLIRSFTEPDEDLVFDHFGVDVDTLLDAGMKSARAALMVHKVRAGMPADEARALVRGLTRAEVDDHFAGLEPDEVMPDEPETEAGKETSGLDSEPGAKPDSVSPLESPPPITED